MKPCLAADITIGYCSRHVDVAQVTTCSSCISFQKRRKVGKSLVSSNVLLIIPHNEDNMQLYHGFLTGKYLNYIYPLEIDLQTFLLKPASALNQNRLKSNYARC